MVKPSWRIRGWVVLLAVGLASGLADVPIFILPGFTSNHSVAGNLVAVSAMSRAWGQTDPAPEQTPSGAKPSGNLSAQLTSPPDGLRGALAIQSAFVNAIEVAEKSVVAIARVRRETNPLGLNRIGPRLGGLQDVRPDPRSPEFVPNEYGAGVIVSENGLILTTAHVLGDVEKNDYFVWINRKPYYVQSDSIRTDPWWDLAVLKIEAKSLTPVKMAEKHQPRKGSFVVALGNPYAIARDGQASASWGMISNVRRRAPRLRRRNPDAPLGQQRSQETLHESGTLLQTDARLEAGYSGGALINFRGEMIGLTTAQAGGFGAAGQPGFAIPVDKYFLKALDDLKNNRTRNHGFLGVQMQPDGVESGVRVASVDPNSSPFRAGLRTNDIITHVDGDAVRDSADLVGLVSRRSADEYVVLRIQSFGFSLNRQREIRVQLAKRPNLMTSRGTWGGEKQTWRGMQVDYFSAIRQGRFAPIRGVARIGVLTVQRDSPAWEAGVRDAQAIVKVNGKPIATPDAFYAAVEDSQGAVTILDGAGRTHVVPPPQ